MPSILTQQICCLLAQTSLRVPQPARLGIPPRMKLVASRLPLGMFHAVSARVQFCHYIVSLKFKIAVNDRYLRRAQKHNEGSGRMEFLITI